MCGLSIIITTHKCSLIKRSVKSVCVCICHVSRSSRLSSEGQGHSSKRAYSSSVFSMPSP